MIKKEKKGLVIFPALGAATVFRRICVQLHLPVRLLSYYKERERERRKISIGNIHTHTHTRSVRER